MNHEITVYLDMDGVLVGFNRGYSQIYNGMEFKDYADKYGKDAANRKFQVRTEDFWANLPWEDGGQQVYKAAKKLYKDVCILSSCGCPQSDPKSKERYERVKQGKLQWIKNYKLEFTKIHIVPNRHDKQKFANPMSILVDDLGSNIQEWNLANGMGIQHDYRNYTDTIIELFELSKPVTFSEIARHVKEHHLSK